MRARVLIITRHLRAAALAVAVLFAVRSNGQGTLQPLLITFDGPPPQPAGTAAKIQRYDEGGVSFTPIGAVGFVRQGGSVSFYPENGTAYLQSALGCDLKFSFTNGYVFNLDAVDLAEYSTVFNRPITVHFIGYRHDGTIVTTDQITDGIIDGTGPLADFQTFTFGKEFTDLDRVEVLESEWSLDNLIVSRNVPEPGTYALLIAGGVILFARHRLRANRGW